MYYTTVNGRRGTLAAILTGAVALLLLVGAGVAGAGPGGQVDGAVAQGGIQPQLFLGQNDTGDFQAALDDALFQADLFYASIGADIRYSYRVLRTSGSRGGLVFLDDIRVEVLTVGQ